MRLLYTLAFVLLASIAYGQKSTLYQNVNVRAKELKHNLNNTGDNLILKCERTIYEVVIFNDDFERVIKVRDNDVVIPIADVPVGRYIVEALLSDKLIVITLLRNEPFGFREAAPLITDSSDLFGTKTAPKKEIIADVEPPKSEEPKYEAEVKVAVDTKKSTLPQKETYGEESYMKKIDLAVAGKKATPAKKEIKLTEKETIAEKKQPMMSSLSLFKSKAKVTKKTVEASIPDIELAKSNRIYSTYWVVYKINNGQSSEKIQKMSDQDAVDRLIKKNEIDKKTKTGRLNELTVWTVYDPTKFVQHKRKNKEDYMNIASESFKIEPYYQTVHEADNL
ncbi:hypothetical protein [Winogradskyella schleiferi]|uniref:hypothetical protein n=1 Tax=Winogradskyella schleiferi TaxID=2686078 RepID=UPI0015BC9478|nr:hypothetical protein [Winogradskyella schleiferi]